MTVVFGSKVSLALEKLTMYDISTVIEEYIGRLKTNGGTDIIKKKLLALTIWILTVSRTILRLGLINGHVMERSREEGLPLIIVFW